VVDRLAALGRAHELAGIALRTCTEEYEVAELDRRLPASLVAVRPDLGGALVTRVLGRVLALETADRDTLLSTLAAWVDCGGSAQRTGRRLFCHRNTVLNRLRRLEQLTERSLAHPRDSMELTLALEAYRIAGWRVSPVAAEV
jgi:DNA-binding PucR family transcriptional regulator